MRPALCALLLIAACAKHDRKPTEIDMRAPDQRQPVGGGPDTPPPPDELGTLPATTLAGNAVPQGVLTIKMSRQSLSVGDDPVGAFVQPPATESVPMWIDATSEALVKAGGSGVVIVRGTADTPFELADIAAGGAAAAGRSELAIIARGPDGKETALPACAPNPTGTCQGQALADPVAKHYLLKLMPGGAAQLAPVTGPAPPTALSAVTPEAIAKAVTAFDAGSPAVVHVTADPGVTLSDLVKALAIPAGPMRMVIGGAPEPVPAPTPPSPTEAPMQPLHAPDMPDGIVG